MSITLDGKEATTDQVCTLAKKYKPYSSKPIPFNLAVQLIREHAEHTVHVLAIGD